MDIGNLNKVYSIVSSAGNQQILNVSGDQKVLSLADGSSQLTSQQIEDNRKFRQGLLDSLTAITNDQAVLAEVRNKLGLAEGDEKADPKSIFARDIKAAIDVVMANVSKRIGEVLTRQFPAAVSALILEAVKANPKHEVVKAFLAKEGGTLNNLARLCRLTCQSLKDGANSAALAYLDGFAYDVADFEGVQRSSEEYNSGLNHRKEEENAEKEKLKEKAPVQTEQIVKEGNAKVAQEQTEEKKVEPPQIQEAKPKEANDSAIVKDLKKALGGLYNDYVDVSSKLLSCIEAHGEEWANLFFKIGLTLDGVEHDLVTDKERYAILARAINKSWLAAGQPVNDKDVKIALENVVTDAFARYEQVVRFRTAVDDIKGTLADKTNAVKEMSAGFVKSAKEDLLKEINALTSIEAESGEAYDLMNNVLKTPKKDDEQRIALKNKLVEILKGFDSFSVTDVRGNEPDVGLELVDKEADIHTAANKTNTNNVKFKQASGTNLCYLRCIENGLIASNQAGRLPKLQSGEGLFSSKKYTFPVDIGDEKSLPENLTVTKAEIDNLKEWYNVNWKRYNGVKGYANASSQVQYDPTCTKYDSFKDWDKQKGKFTDLDWAINIALAKRAMWQDAQKGMRNGKAEAPKPLGIDNLHVGWTTLTGGYANKGYEHYLKRQLVTQMGRDTDVAGFFGLKDDANYSVNHNFSTEDKLVQNKDDAEYPNDLEVFKRWSKVRQWKREHKGGILTLNVSNRHFVSVRDFYYNSDNDFGFIVRDSNDSGKNESKINVNKYIYGENPDVPELDKVKTVDNKALDDKKAKNKNRDTLHIHCFLPVS